MKRRIFAYMCIISGTVVVLSAVVTLCVGLAALRARALPEPAPVEYLPWVLAACVVVFAVGCALAGYLSRLVVNPLKSDSVDYEELLPLIRRMEKQRSELRRSETVISERESGLATIMEYMTEGIVILDRRAIVISVNRSALSLLEAEPGYYIGRDILAVNRNSLLQAAVYAAIGGIAGEETLRLKNGTVQLSANPVLVEGVVCGVVLLVFDVTEKQAAEQMRREFSANVSHELKTPLTSISGYAEIIRDGLVRPEDVPRFAGSIHDEAKRLIALIEDIIRLSRLDEGGGQAASEAVELHSLAECVVSRLLPKAERCGVTVELKGEAAVVHGSAQLLEEMVFNLCDNSIKYNRPGGLVRVTVEPEPNGTTLTVADNGIGIPREHQPRVFERFYRVDKSHSKETGGTGLGLSIVKHGAMYHRATIELDSSPDAGTTIRLRFPK